MHDFNCNDSDDRNYKILADRAKYFKENPEEVKTMCKAMDDLRIESERRGEIKGIVETYQELAKTITDASYLFLNFWLCAYAAWCENHIFSASGFSNPGAFCTRVGRDSDFVEFR